MCIFDLDLQRTGLHFWKEEMDPVDTFENNMSEGSTSAVGVSRNRTVIRGHVPFHDSSKQNVRERYTLRRTWTINNNLPLVH